MPVWLSNLLPFLKFYLLLGAVVALAGFVDKYRKAQLQQPELTLFRFWCAESPVIATIALLVIAAGWLPMVLYSAMGSFFPEWNRITMECWNCGWETNARVTTEQLDQGFVVHCKHCKTENDINRQDVMVQGY